MTNGLNKVLLMGNLGADPELRSTGSNKDVLNFRIACTEVYFDKDRNKKENTEWVRVVVWEPRAEPLSKILVKGMSVFIEGRLSTREYEKDGQKHYVTEVIATNVIIASAKPGQGNEQARGREDRDTRAPKRGDDDIPF